MPEDIKDSSLEESLQLLKDNPPVEPVHHKIFDAPKKIKLELNYEQTFSTILKNSKGAPSKKKLSISVGLVVKNERDNVLTNKNFSEEFSYDVQSNKFNMSQYEDSITSNLNNKISNDIIFLLRTLK